MTHKNLFQIALEHEQRHPSPATNEGIGGAVSNEGFMDWLKDFFTASFTPRHLALMRSSTTELREASEIMKDSIRFTPHQFQPSQDVFSLMLKRGTIVDDLADELMRDGENLGLFIAALQNVNQTLKKIELRDNNTTALSVLDSSFDANAVGALSGTNWLNNVQLYVNEKSKLHEVSTWAPDDFSDEQTDTFLEVLTAEDREQAVKNGLRSYLNNVNYEKTVEKINRALKKDTVQLKKATQKVYKKSEELHGLLTEFFKHNQRLGKSQSSVVRGFLRRTQPLGYIPVYLVCNYASGLMELTKY